MLATHEYANDLILFALIVDYGSFSKAAESAGITSSVVSKRIGRLEKSLGARLLYRTTRSLTLTESGQGSTNRPKRSAPSAGGTVRRQRKKRRINRYHPHVGADHFGRAAAEREAWRSFALHPSLKVEMRLENRFVDLVERHRSGDPYRHYARFEPDCPADLRFPLGDRLLAGLFGKPPEPRSAEDLLGHNCLTYTYQGRAAPPTG